MAGHGWLTSCKLQRLSVCCVKTVHYNKFVIRTQRDGITQIQMLKKVDRILYVFKTSNIDTRFEIFAIVLINTEVFSNWHKPTVKVLPIFLNTLRPGSLQITVNIHINVGRLLARTACLYCTQHNGSNTKQHPQHSCPYNMTSPNLLSGLKSNCLLRRTLCSTHWASFLTKFAVSPRGCVPFFTHAVATAVHHSRSIFVFVI